VRGYEWALDILQEEGYSYDSSIFPIRRSATYGYAGAPEEPYVHELVNGSLWELPLTPLRVGRARVPACGGAYFRHLPYALARRALQQCAERGSPGVFYLHPWEVDPEQPRVATSLLTRLRQYGGVRRMERRLERLLSEFRFTTAAHTLGLQAELTRPLAASASSP
jgi:polysaccharide deacetylase family protein (PEP-CTERM system associated)